MRCVIIIAVFISDVQTYEYFCAQDSICTCDEDESSGFIKASCFEITEVPYFITRTLQRMPHIDVLSASDQICKSTTLAYGTR